MSRFSQGFMGNAAEIRRGHIPFLPVLLSPPLPFLFISFQGSMGKGHCIPELPECTYGRIFEKTKQKPQTNSCRIEKKEKKACQEQNKCHCHTVKAVKSSVDEEV